MNESDLCPQNVTDLNTWKNTQFVSESFAWCLFGCLPLKAFIVFVSFESHKYSNALFAKCSPFNYAWSLYTIFRCYLRVSMGYC